MRTNTQQPRPAVIAAFHYEEDELRTARNSLDSGFAKAQAAFEFNCEMEKHLEERRRDMHHRRREAKQSTYEPPAAPDVSFPQTARYEST